MNIDHTANEGPNKHDGIEVDFSDVFAKARGTHAESQRRPWAGGLVEGTQENADFKLSYYTEAALKVLIPALAGTRAQGFEFTADYLRRVAQVCAMHIVYPSMSQRWAAFRRVFGTETEEEFLKADRGKDVICHKPVNRADIVSALTSAVLQLSRIEDDQFKQLEPSLYTYRADDREGSPFSAADLPAMLVRDKLHAVLCTPNYKPTPPIQDLKGVEHKEDRTEIDCTYEAILEAVSSGALLELESREEPGVLGTFIRTESNGSTKPNLKIYPGISNFTDAIQSSSVMIHIDGWGSNAVELRETGKALQKITLEELGARWKFYKRAWKN